MQKQTSCIDQIRECGNIIAKKDWELLENHIYKDEAVFGYDIFREGYLALKKAANSDKFDYIVVDDLS